MRSLNWLLESFPFFFFCGLIRLSLHYLGWLEMSEGRLGLIQIITGLGLVLTLGHLLYKIIFRRGRRMQAEF